MNVFDVTLPFSYFALSIFFFLGILFTILVFGTLTAILVIVCIYSGILRISPILEACTTTIKYIYPGFLESLRKNLKESFILDYPNGKPIQKPYILLFHPHGLFSFTNIFHIGTDITDWFIRPIQATVLDKLYWLPFGKEILDRLKCVPSKYEEMKEVLTNGHSLSVCLGGVREILYTEPNLLKLSIQNKRGVFRLAIQTGTPLIPILSYGENELFDIVKSEWLSWIQSFLIEYGLCIPLPTIESCKSWFSILYGPLKSPIRTVIGSPIDVGHARDPTEIEIIELRDRYFNALKQLYYKTRPTNYAKDLEII